MSCTQCLKVQSLPRCLDEDVTEYLLEGPTFPDNPGEMIRAEFTNLATGRQESLLFASDSAPDMIDMFPLPLHVHQVRYYAESGALIEYTLGEETGCCIEFDVADYTSETEGIELTTDTCTTE